MADTPKAANAQIEMEIDKLIDRACNTFKLEIDGREIRHKALEAIPKLESADPILQDKGQEQLNEIKNTIKEAAVKRYAGGDGDFADSLRAMVESQFKSNMDAHTTDLAATRLANALVDLRSTSLTGGDTQKAKEHLASVLLSKDVMLNAAALAAATRLKEFAVMTDSNRDGILDAAELHTAYVTVKPETKISIAEFTDPLIKAGAILTEQAPKKDAPASEFDSAANQLKEAARQAGEFLICISQDLI